MISIINFILGFYLLVLLTLAWRSNIRNHIKPNIELILLSFAVITLVAFNVNEVIGSYRWFGLFKYPSTLYAITGGWPSYMISKLVSLVALLPATRRQLILSKDCNNHEGNKS